MNVLISGISGDIGFNCARILRSEPMVGKIHGSDIRHSPITKCFTNSVSISPPAVSPEYIEWLRGYLVENDIRLFIPTSEAEIAALSQSKDLGGDVIALMLRKDIIDPCLDKHRCLDVLERNGVQVPAHGRVGAEWPVGFPVVLKPRAGRGSQNVRIARRKAEFDKLAQESDVWQEFIPADAGEYTCGVFRGKSGETRVITLRRWLEDGTTVRGCVANSASVTAYVERIAEIFDLVGVMNVQLRFKEGKPLLFEINPRLSSTVIFRDRLGFHDLIWWIRDSLGEAVPSYQVPENGIEFFRGCHEFFYPALPNGAAGHV